MNKKLITLCLGSCPLFVLLLGLAVGLPQKSGAALVAEDHFLSGFDPMAGEYVPAFRLVGQSPTLLGWNTFWDNGASEGMAYELGLTYDGLATEGGKGSTDIVDHGTRIGHTLAQPFTSSTSGTYYLSVVLMLRLDDAERYRALELHDGGYDDVVHRKLQVGQYSGDFGASGGWGLRTGGSVADLGTAGTSANLFVLKFDFSTTPGGDAVTVWRNPDSLGGAEPSGGTTISGLDLTFDRISFASWENAWWFPAEDGAIYFDEIRIGATWADVTPVGGQPQPGGNFLVYDFEGSPATGPPVAQAGSRSPSRRPSLRRWTRTRFTHWTR